MTTPPAACGHHRSTLSAAMDGAATDVDRAAAELHVASCADCRAFVAGLDRLRLLVARSVVPPAPDLAPGLTIEPAASRPARRRESPPSVARYLLAALGCAQITLALPALLLGQGAADVHSSRHLGAWAVAFGVGLLVAAGEPRHARALLPVAVTLTLTAAATTVVDLLSGRMAAGPEAAHLLELVGLALLAVVHRQARGHHPSQDVGAGPPRRPAPVV